MFGVRLRFWTSKGLSTEEDSYKFNVKDVEVNLLREDRLSLKKPGWLVLKATGFAQKEDAEDFGRQIALALQIASVRRFWGADIGHDMVTAGLFRPMREALEASGQILRDNVHGLDVFPDMPETYWLGINARARISTNPLPVIADIQMFAGSQSELPQPLIEALRIWNEAIICEEPIAQALLAITSIETLAKGLDWSTNQKTCINELSALVDSIENLSASEREEITDAIQRMHRFGVNQGIRRILEELDIMDLWRDWNKLYSHRSKFIHGALYSDKGTRSRLAHPALALSGRILLSALARHVPGAAHDIDSIMPVPTIDF